MTSPCATGHNVGKCEYVWGTFLKVYIAWLFLSVLCVLLQRASLMLHQKLNCHHQQMWCSRSSLSSKHNSQVSIEMIRPQIDSQPENDIASSSTSAKSIDYLYSRTMRTHASCFPYSTFHAQLVPPMTHHKGKLYEKNLRLSISRKNFTISGAKSMST